jgi:uncharacterized protein (DUF433 family)
MNVATLSEAIPISIDRDVMSGTPVFQGTRVPVRTLFDYIADGSNLDEFLENFPTVRREHALKVLEFVTTNLVVGVTTH